MMRTRRFLKKVLTVAKFEEKTPKDRPGLQAYHCGGGAASLGPRAAGAVCTEDPMAVVTLLVILNMQHKPNTKLILNNSTIK